MAGLRFLYAQQINVNMWQDEPHFTQNGEQETFFLG